MRKTITLELDDRWEPGWCDNCPLGYEESIYDEDDGWDSWCECVLDSDAEHCPLGGIANEVD